MISCVQNGVYVIRLDTYDNYLESVCLSVCS